jgi:arginine decarboxylase
LKIEIVFGSGSGKTCLAAFDRALFEAGISNYNLIPLSSVIPPQTEVVIKDKRTLMSDEYGYKLYVVMAESYATEAGKEAWAGLGWVHHNDNSGKGLFVEHDGENEKDVIEQITDTLYSMSEYRPEEKGEIFHKTHGIKCLDAPVCSVVVAVYKSEGWD